MVAEEKTQLVLVSQSPRRKELIKRLDLPFCTVQPDHLHEDSQESVPQSHALEVAQWKMDSVLSQNTPTSRQVWISADTIVVYQEHLLGKPKDRDDAFRMLATLCGNWHFVYTGVVLNAYGYESDAQKIHFCEETRVKFRNVPSSMIQRILDKEEALDKAGAYAIQGYGGLLVERIIGDYYNVMGFPLGRIWETLMSLGAY